MSRFGVVGILIALTLLVAACTKASPPPTTIPTPNTETTVAAVGQNLPTQTPFPTYTPLATYTPLPTIIPSPVPTLAPKSTETPRPTPTAIPLPTPTPEPTPVPTAPPTPMPTPTPTATPIPTPTPNPTVTPSLPELHDTQNTRWLKRAYRDLYQQIQRFPWVQDGLSATETETIDELLYIGVDEITNLRETLNLSWLQDAISETENEAIDRLKALGYYDTASLKAVLSLPWVQDAISETEYDIIDWLASVGYKTPQATAAMIPMPFLESPDTNDALAIRSMARLAGKGVVSEVVNHPIFQDGIAETETTLIAAAGALYRDAEEIGRLLDPGYATIETVSSGTKLTPGLKVSIVRTGTQSRPGTVEAVKDAVAFVERVMGLPLPVAHVIVLLNDKAVTKDYAGTNYGFAVGYLPEYEQRQDTWEWRKLQTGLVHEISHYFWRGNVGWIDEGVTNTVEYMHGLENGLSRGQLKQHRKDCEAHDLAMLSESDPDSSSREYLCNYYLGQGLFQELLESLGNEAFGERLHELYRLSLEQQEVDLTPSIEAVQQVFETQADIINRHWAGAMNAPENRPFDEGIDRTNHDLIQWNRHPTYDGRSVAFEGVLLDGAVLSSATIHQARGGGYQNFTLDPADAYEYAGGILPPLTDGRNWVLDDPGDSEATTYQLDASGFSVEFPFPEALGNPSDYVVTVWGFQNDSRTPGIGKKIDLLGYARIRVP